MVNIRRTAPFCVIKIAKWSSQSGGLHPQSAGVLCSAPSGLCAIRPTGRYCRGRNYIVPLHYASGKDFAEDYGAHSSVGRALDCGSRCREFEPLWAPYGDFTFVCRVSFFAPDGEKRVAASRNRGAATLHNTVAPYFLSESTLWMRSSMAALSWRSLSVRKSSGEL